MDNLLPLSSLNDEKRELFSKVVLGIHEREALIKFIADELTIEVMAEMLDKVASDSCKCPDFTLYDQILWLSRLAYLAGFDRGVQIYSNIVEIALRE